MSTRSAGRFFYRVFLPIAVTVNLGLGVAVLSNLRPEGWLGWLEVVSGGFCCVVAGWLAASAWSKSYWGSAMARQIAAWRQIADAIFAWLEDAPLPAEALQRLKTSLDEVGAHPKSRSI
jgi:TRAP-type C4-dicarboxylate transport system permease small subunit